MEAKMLVLGVLIVVLLALYANYREKDWSRIFIVIFPLCAIFSLIFVLSGSGNKTIVQLWTVVKKAQAAAPVATDTSTTTPHQSPLQTEPATPETDQAISTPVIKAVITPSTKTVNGIEYPNGTTIGNLLPLYQLESVDFAGSANIDNIKKHYYQIVDDSRTYNYDPAITMAIWVEESAASDYARFPKVADFGCIGEKRVDFDIQLRCFLGLWQYYATDPLFAVCRGEDKTLSFREFLLIYEGGFGSCIANKFLAEPNFPARLIKTYRLVTGGAKLDFGEPIPTP
jgi:hypothetical protein